jgi:diguanylate cyclase (GGDEF)-like protein/PAS domain S-box-containing protein
VTADARKAVVRGHAGVVVPAEVVGGALVGVGERFRAVYGASPAGIVETDLQHRIVHCNAAFAAMLGLTELDVVGHYGWEFFHPDSPVADPAAVQDLVGGVRASYSVLRLLRAPDGSPLAVKLDWAPVVAVSGAVTHVVCVVTDVSEQARDAVELVRARERAEALWQQASIGVVEGTTDGVITAVNATFARMVGYGPEELVGTLASALADPAYTAEIAVGVEQLKGGVGYAAERRYLSADGRSLPVLVSTAVLHDENGVVDRFAGFVVDMGELHAQRTALTEARDELVRQQSFTDALLETLEVGVSSCAADGTQLYRNRVQREIFGLDASSSGAPVEEVTAALEVLTVQGGVLDPADYPLPRALAGRGPGVQELLVGPPGGPHRHLVVRSSAITAPEGALLGAVSAMSDVTVERRAARELADEHGRLTEAQRLGQLGSFTLDVPTGRFWFSEEIYRIWGLPQGADLGSLRAQLIHPEDLVAVRTGFEAALVAGGRHSTTYRIIRPDGDLRHLRVELDVELAPGGQARVVRGTHLDVTDLTVARLAATEANAVMTGVLAASPDFMFVTDVRTGAVVYAPPGKDLLGTSSEALVEHGAGAIAALVHPEDQDRLKATNASAGDLADGEVLQIRYRLQHTDGSWRWLSRRVTPFRRDGDGAVVEVLGVLRDVTDVVQAQSRLEFSALHDALTGLPNRALLMDRLRSALGRAEQTGRRAVVLFCDLDGFKRVNDTGGHAAGDAVLVETTRRINGVLREHDTVARVGGDEFVVVVEPWKREDLDGSTDEQVLAVELAERLAVALREPIEVDGVEHVVTASIGITYAGPGAVDAEDVLADADAAMYRAKHGGKDRFEVFEHGLRTDIVERARVEQLLRRCLADPEVSAPQGGPTLTAAYQPVVDSATGTLVGFEALARLTDSAGGAVAPEVFIPIAESTGLIRAVDVHMLDQACRRLARWRQHTPGLQHVTMAVNISAFHAQHTFLVDDVRSALRTHGLAPADLILELTESVLLEAAPSTLTALRTLRGSGVGISIDDFGTGYASLRYLVTLPVSAVKVDRSFTAGLPHDKTSRTIVRAVAGLAKDLHLSCIVEGVETQAQRAALPPGVQIQGWLTGRPTTDPNITALTTDAAFPKRTTTGSRLRPAK